MNEIKYTCVRGDGHTLSFYPGGGGKSGFRISRGSSDDFIDLSREDAADLARRLAEHVGLTIEPEPFKREAAFEDVRKGDLVQVDNTRDDLTITRTGVAYYLLSSGWYTPDGRILCGYESSAITILSRPEPPELPTTPGAVVVVGTKTYALEERTADLIWRNLADPTDFYSYEWPGDNDWTATGLKVVVA